MEHNNDNDELTNNNDLDTGSVSDDLSVNGVNGQVELIRFCNVMKYPKMGGVLSIGRYNKGVKPHSYLDKAVFSLSYYRILNESVPKKYLDTLFPKFQGKHSRIAFKVLQALNSHPNSNMAYVCKLTQIHNSSLRIVLDKLVEIGMLVIDSKWRLMWVFGAYKRDVVYCCSKKGKEALRQIYMDNGLLN